MRVLVLTSALVLTALPAARAVTAIAPGQITSSAVCGTCHRDIFRMWRASAHSTSVENVVFQDALAEADRRTPGTARICLGCHAPFAELGNDFALRQQVTWEGVSCDACHSLVSVAPGPHGFAQTLDPGPVKHGPIRDAVSTAHATAYSPLHTTAMACAGCHEYVTSDGTPIITTFSEWQASTFGQQNRTCQSCHMSLTRAAVVDPRVKRVATDQVNLHEMPGGHSLSQLNKGVTVTERAARQGDEMTLTVTVANKGAGHSVPTGMPGRRIILDVRVTTPTDKFEDRRVYTKTFQDATGATIDVDGAAFGPGVRLVEDSRIKAGEQRVETFHFPVPARETATATVKLHYEHQPGSAPENRTWFTFYSQSRAYPPDAP